MEKVERNCFVGTPGSFISDCFFFDELSKICGHENAQLWLTAQLNARSFCATATPGTPQTISAPTSPRVKIGIPERESHFMPNLQAFSEHSKSFSSGSHVARDWGDSGLNSDGSSNFRSRFHSFSHSRKVDLSRPNKSWKQWKSYADGHPKAPPCHISPTLPEHQEQSESHSSDSSENCETAERSVDHSNKCESQTGTELLAEAKCIAAKLSAVSENKRDPEPSACVSDAGSLRRSLEADRPISMRSLQQLVLEQEKGQESSGVGTRMGLLFTDAAHTVLER
jgi:hypothetical protein